MKLKSKSGVFEINRDDDDNFSLILNYYDYYEDEMKKEGYSYGITESIHFDYSALDDLFEVLLKAKSLEYYQRSPKEQLRYERDKAFSRFMEE